MGYHYEKKAFDQFKVETAALGKEQKDEAVQKDKENLQHATQTTTDSTNAIASITAYYKSHPVRVCGNTGSSPASQAVSDSIGTNEASASAVPETQYISQYNDEVTEGIAVQLDQLMKLLKEDGVKIE
jgi:hypothetical protein